MADTDVVVPGEIEVNNELINSEQVNEQEQDRGTPLETEQAFNDEDGSSDDDDDDIQIRIGDIKPNVPFQAIQKGIGSGGATGQPAGKLDIDQTAEIAGQPLYDIDLATLEEKPWRKPGADLTDYFNYGFTEETWDMYCERQRKLRSEYGSGNQGNVNKVLFSQMLGFGSNLQGIPILKQADKRIQMQPMPSSDSSPKLIVNLAEKYQQQQQQPPSRPPPQQQIYRTILTGNAPDTPTSANTTGSIPVLTTPMSSSIQLEMNQPSAIQSSVAATPAPVQVVNLTQPVVSFSDGPPGVDSSDPLPPGSTPPPGTDTPPVSSAAPPSEPSTPRPIPTLGGPPGGGMSIDTSVPPPRFNTSVPPPGMGGQRQPPPGMPPTNMPPPPFGGGLLPPGVSAPPPGFGPVRFGPPGVRPPFQPQGFVGFPPRPQVPDRDRSPASYSDKSSGDEDYHRHRAPMRPRREYATRPSTRRSSRSRSRSPYQRRGRTYRVESGSESRRETRRHRSRSRSESPRETRVTRSRTKVKEEEQEKSKRRPSSKKDDEKDKEKDDEKRKKRTRRSSGDKSKEKEKDKEESDSARKKRRIKEEPKDDF